MPSGGVNIITDLFVFLAGTAGSFGAREFLIRRRARKREAKEAPFQSAVQDPQSEIAVRPLQGRND